MIQGLLPLGKHQSIIIYIEQWDMWVFHMAPLAPLLILVYGYLLYMQPIS